jgi:hypothetical protein
MRKKMRSIFKTGILYLALAFVAVNSKAQVAESVRNSFKEYNDKVLKEKIYVHTDKNFYLTGEILWFKLYNVDAASNKPVDISKVAYVEVLDANNNPVLQAKIALAGGAGNGSFYIPVTLKNGNYKLRAYTNWMKNFGPDVFFEKVITLVNPLIEPTSVVKEPAKSVSIKFFAESGNLVAGVITTVGFKATSTDGKGMNVSGVVINQRNDTVARFETLKFGMGSFLLTPEVNSSYKAVMRIGKNDVLITDLPSVTSKGYSIHLANLNNQPEIKISERGTLEPLYLILHSGRQVLFAQSIVPDAEGNATIRIDKAKLGKGINHITLFNNARQPVCERLFFNKPDILNLHASVQPQFKSRSAVTIPVATISQSGIPMAANISVAVFKADSLTTADPYDIASYFWLSSELKGFIESPRYYFDNANTETDTALDNLLLIQGWSRFKWDDVLNPKQKFTYLPEFEGHLITGKLTNAEDKPTVGTIAYLGVPGKRVQLYGAAADSAGRLLFNTKQLFGPGEIVLQTDTEKDSSLYNITINNPFIEQYTASSMPAFRLNSQWQTALEYASVGMQVQNIYMPDKLRQFINPQVDSAAFYGSLHKPYLLDDFTRFKTMEEVLREYVAEMTVSRRQKRIHFNILGSGKTVIEGDPLVMLDGVPIFNMDKVFLIDPLKIRKLDMVNQYFYWGPTTSSGIISMTSYKGDMAGFEIDPKAVVLDYEGMQLQREFYSPVYETEQQKNSRMPDFRNVLYWAPDINTDKQGKANILFYTSDKTGSYIVVLQGLTAGGQAGSYSLRFDVAK